MLVVSLWLCSAVGPSVADPRQPPHLVFGFLPIVSSEQLVRRFSPLAEYLTRRLGIDVRMETAPDFATFIHRTQDEKRYDILFTAPHLYYLARRQSDYRALVRVDKPGMKAVIVAPRQSGIRSLEDLRGRRLATTDPLALATVLVRSLLLQSGLDPDRDLTLVATPSHNASLLSSYQGATDASALILPLYHRSKPEIQAAMTIVAETRSVPHMPISVAPWVDAAIVTRLGESLAHLGADPQGRTVLQKLGWPGLTAARADEYDNLGWVARQAGVP